MEELQRDKSNPLEPRKSKNQETFTYLIESTIPELEASYYDINKNPDFFYYHQILLYYYKTDIEKLKLLIKDIRHNKKLFLNLDHYHIVYRLAQLRFSIRKNKVSMTLIHTLLDLQNTVTAKAWFLWSGEIYGIIAFALGEIANFELSKKFYEMAIAAFHRISANKKKIRAIHNYIATLASLNSNKSLIKEYLFVFRQAYKQKSFDFAGLALGNIAREYQTLGLLDAAEKYSKKSLSYAMENPFTVQYYLVHLFRAHILIDLKRHTEAMTIIHHCKSSTYAEIRGGALILESIILGVRPSYIKLNKQLRLLPGWMERLQLSFKKNKPPLEPTELETKLIYFISTKERSREQVIHHLYGERIDREYTINRLNVLLSRINQKWPRLITKNSENKYILT